MENIEKITDSQVILTQRVGDIQHKLKAPKGQYNSFGKYNYRSCEDILEGVKPLLKEHDLALLIDDEIVQIGERYYVKATAKITDGREIVSATAYAREPDTKKGMDESQITGATSSYARKYALNALLCIDDTKDADTMDNSKKPVQQTQETVYNWQTLKARATQGGISEDDLKHYLKETLKVNESKDMTQEHYQQAFNWVNAQRYAKR
ncbi:ERF family protein [Veillonella rodentium]|uniref:ERF superfamily n=1 Tax=Veillonella rodentium TaxID=248315 RepID=A0A239Z9L3_9FIRM|nr:ERF family protein [Veillonella rodentium]SNV67862.1 ERF superfamily [Veillonella rodentium]